MSFHCVHALHINACHRSDVCWCTRGISVVRPHQSDTVLHQRARESLLFWLDGASHGNAADASHPPSRCASFATAERRARHSASLRLHGWTGTFAGLRVAQPAGPSRAPALRGGVRGHGQHGALQGGRRRILPEQAGGAAGHQVRGQLWSFVLAQPCQDPAVVSGTRAVACKAHAQPSLAAWNAPSHPWLRLTEGCAPCAARTVRLCAAMASVGHYRTP